MGWQTQYRSSLIWVCTVCSDLFVPVHRFWQYLMWIIYWCVCRSESIRHFRVFYTGGHQGKYREIACGTSHGSANWRQVFVNTGRFSRVFQFIVEEYANYVKLRQCYSMVIWFTFLRRPSKNMEKSFPWVGDRNKIEPRTAFLDRCVNSKE